MCNCIQKIIIEQKMDPILVNLHFTIILKNLIVILRLEILLPAFVIY